MGINDKYSTQAGCCGDSNQPKTFESGGCCESDVQAAPTACCESHTTIMVPGICFRPECTVTATGGRFYLYFSNTCENSVPIEAGTSFFYSQSAGFMNIHSFDGRSFEVSLSDPTKEGRVIAKGECVTHHTENQNATSGVANSRCLCGKFNPPTTNQDETIYIFNGQGIPIGSTLTFTANGETGSYLVKSFDSASGPVFSYTVTNTGNGHTPGVILDGGDEGACLVPIEVITDVDICDLTATQTADTLTACVNGSPRAFTPSSSGQTIVSNSENKFELQPFISTDCCFLIDGCLKFTDAGSNVPFDTVVIKSPIPECLGEMFAKAEASGSTATVNIAGVPFVLSAYNEGAQTVTMSPATESFFDGQSFVEYEDGTQVCFGECCSACDLGPQITDYKTIGEGDPEKAATFAIQTISAGGDPLEYDAVVGNRRHYLIGYDFNPALTPIVQELDATYNDDPSSFGPGKPRITDALFYRQKICNTSPKGCSQECEVEFNYDFAAADLPDLIRVNCEIGHFVQPSLTLQDDLTINPFAEISSQASRMFDITGPAVLDLTVTPDTSLGYGSTVAAKANPANADTTLKDFFTIGKSDCGLSILWVYVNVETLPGYTGAAGAFNVSVGIRRRIKKYDSSRLEMPANNPDSEDFRN